MYKRNDHFFQRNTSMLEGVSVITYIVVEVIRVSKKLILFNEQEYAAYMLAR
jgi:hypothetical protein